MRRIRLVVALALAGLLALGTMPVAALADDADLDDLQAKVEQSGAAYDDACAAVNALNEQIAQNQQAIDEVEAQLPAQRAKAAAAISADYKMRQNTPGLVELILSSADFDEFLSTIRYLNAVQGQNADATARLVEMENELTRNQQELEAKQEEAERQKDAAATALAEAQEARQEAQRIAEEKAKAEAEAAAAAVAAEKAAAEKAAQEQAEADAKAAAASASTASSNASASAPVNQAPSSSSVPSQTSPSTVDWSQDKATFVNTWAPRINAYLAGSPMAGTGQTFAEAAWDYGVDPRWSPAIAYVESSKGLYCFKPYNAWGWGTSSWSNWDEAIRAHVAGLARVYGPTLTYEAAKKYCPPNADHWYSTCLAEMEKI